MNVVIEGPHVYGNTAVSVYVCPCLFSVCVSTFSLCFSVLGRLSVYRSVCGFEQACTVPQFVCVFMCVCVCVCVYVCVSRCV